MDIFQGLSSTSVPLCLTSWENQTKSAKTSQKKLWTSTRLVHPGSNFKTSEGTACICTYHSGRRRILSPRDERTLVRKVQINPRTTAKDLVKMLVETSTKVSIFTMKRVLYRHNLKGRSLLSGGSGYVD